MSNMKNFSKLSDGAFVLDPSKANQFFAEKKSTSLDLLKRLERLQTPKKTTSKTKKNQKLFRTLSKVGNVLN